MNKQQRPSGPRCAGCGRVFQPRVLRDGSLSQTCGQTACVAIHNRRKNFNSANRVAARPKQPKDLNLV